MVESRVVVRNAAGVHGQVRLAIALDGSSVDAADVWSKLWMGDHSDAVFGVVRVGGTR